MKTLKVFEICLILCTEIPLILKIPDCNNCFVLVRKFKKHQVVRSSPNGGRNKNFN